MADSSEPQFENAVAIVSAALTNNQDTVSAILFSRRNLFLQHKSKSPISPYFDSMYHWAFSGYTYRFEMWSPYSKCDMVKIEKEEDYAFKETESITREEALKKIEEMLKSGDYYITHNARIRFDIRKPITPEIYAQQFMKEAVEDFATKYGTY